MKRYALFVGINEYKDQSISRLRCAGNDAKALCMQFAKSGFETSTLLLNSEASCSRIFAVHYLPIPVVSGEFLFVLI